MRKFYIIKNTGDDPIHLVFDNGDVSVLQPTQVLMWCAPVEQTGYLQHLVDAGKTIDVWCNESVELEKTNSDWRKEGF